MLKSFKKIFLFLILILPCRSTLAQVSTQEKAATAPGSIDKVTNVDRFNKLLFSTKGISTTQAQSLKKSFQRQEELLLKPSPLNPPTGFNVHFVLSNPEAPGLFDNLKMPKSDIMLMLNYLFRNKKTGIINANAMSSADVTIRTNGLEKYFDDGVYAQECDKLKFPVFFEKPEIVDSTADYLETGFTSNNKYDVSNNPVRYIRRNNKPLWIPLTRKDFVQFLIAHFKNEMPQNKKVMSTQEENLAASKKMLSNPDNQNDTKEINYTIDVLEKNIQTSKLNLRKSQEALDECKNLLNTMSREEASAPAYFATDKRNIQDLLNPGSMLTYGKNNGFLLYKINPDYYDKSPGASSVQLLTVSYSCYEEDTFGVDYLYKAAVDIFYQLDYHGLKESMQ